MLYLYIAVRAMINQRRFRIDHPRASTASVPPLSESVAKSTGPESTIPQGWPIPDNNPVRSIDLERNWMDCSNVIFEPMRDLWASRNRWGL